MTTFGQNESKPPAQAYSVESGLSITGGESRPIPILPVVSADEMLGYIVRLNQIAELALLLTEGAPPRSFAHNARHEINHALVVEIPVLIADDRERLLARVAELERQLAIVNALAGEPAPYVHTVTTSGTFPAFPEDTNASR